MALYKTLREAVQAWVNGFDRVPRGILEKWLQAGICELEEITPPSLNDRVFIYADEYYGNEGRIVAVKNDAESGDALYIIELDKGGEATVLAEDFDVERDDTLPMWGTLWSFGNQIDNDWLSEHGGLHLMADCGFRIYEQEDYQYIFGIDGAGYSFMDEHWIPLYKARGLQWHENEEVVA